MSEEKEVIGKRFEKIKKWFRNPYNLALVGILFFAFAIRLYFFIKTQNQALWWDESEYMAAAKSWAFGVPYEYNPQRPPLFQFLSSLAFIAGLGELFIRFALVLIPSTFLVFCVYLLGKEMFDKKIALIAAFLTSVSWTLVFWTARVQPDFLSMCFSVLSVYFMWKHWKNNSAKFVVLSGIFAALGFYFKVSGLLVPMIFIVFIFIKDRFSALTNKYYYYFSFAFLGTLIPYFIWSYIKFETYFGFTRGYIEPVPKATPFGWYNLNFYYYFTEGILFLLFIAGVIISFKFIFYLDILLKDRKKCFDPYIFSLISLAFISAFYIFHIKNTDDRWVFLWLPFIFYLISGAIKGLYNLFNKYSKPLTLVILLLLILIGGYYQIKHANDLIKLKKDSYMPVKEGGIWLKSNSNYGDLFLSISYPQSVYYTELNVSSYSLLSNADEFEEYVSSNNPRFLQVSVFEPHPNWIYEWIGKSQNRLTPVQAYFADPERKQPLLVIYQINY